MSLLGLALLGLVGLLLLTTGLPAYAVLIAAAVVGASAAALAPGTSFALLTALPNRLVNLLENDLLQALPLFVLMGALLNCMSVVPALYKTLLWLLPRRAGAQLASGLALGALLGPMSGSVGASVLALSQSVEPSLADSGVPAPLRQATIALASTLGIVVPPSLVLILLGDAMLNAHTIALNATGRMDRIVNTQDVMRAALVPAGLVVVLSMTIAWIVGDHRTGVRRGRVRFTVVDAPRWGEMAMAMLSVTFLVLLLGGVATGYFYAVEAAAAGAVALFVAGLVSGRLRIEVLSPLLSRVMATTGALFAPLVAATTFTLVLRVLGTDKLIEGWIALMPGGELLAVCVILGALALMAFVLDAFEIIFVGVPVLIPPLLMRAPDAAWIATLVLLTLQISFLVPPAGYALMMTRGVLGGGVPSGAVTRALLPFLAGQLLVLALVLWQPRIVHLLDHRSAADAARPEPALSNDEVERKFREMSKPGGPFGPSPFGDTPFPPPPLAGK